MNLSVGRQYTPLFFLITQRLHNLYAYPVLVMVFSVCGVTVVVCEIILSLINRITIIKGWPAVICILTDESHFYFYYALFNIRENDLHCQHLLTIQGNCNINSPSLAHNS